MLANSAYLAFYARLSQSSVLRQSVHLGLRFFLKEDETRSSQQHMQSKIQFFSLLV